MSKCLFAYMAYKVGFDILEQQVVSWSLPETNCISLL